MYSLDPLQKSDRRLTSLGVLMVLGFALLIGKLWHLQVISFSKYERFREIQSLRNIREPAIRGKIFDRNGYVLADNRPNYGVVIFLEELRPLFQREFAAALEKRGSLSRTQRSQLGAFTRYSVVSNIWFEVTSLVGQPMKLNRRGFERHYEQQRYVPLTIVEDMTGPQVAQFEEQGVHIPAVALSSQSLRYYPNGSLAGHVLGYVRKADPSKERDADKYSYHLPDYNGKKGNGIERIYDDVLQGEPGRKSVLINNLMYRQEEHVLNPPEPGDNLYLTLDARIQQAAEAALLDSGADTMGAVVVMDVNNGDVLAMASSPTFDPNEFVGRLSQDRLNELNDPLLKPLFNRAAYGVYAPGSIFKLIVGLAILEDGGIDPEALWYSLGYTWLRGRLIKDTAGEGEFDFYRAIAKSSNPYFIHHGMEAGKEALIRWGQKFFLGQKTGLLPGQESAGHFPTIADFKKGWHPGETANLCIGQGAVAVTPLQMAVAMSAIANGGTVYQPRLAARVESQSTFEEAAGKIYPEGIVRGHVGASRETIKIIHDAMLVEVESPEGTGNAARVRGLSIGGKTGSAETHKRINGRRIKDTWFASFAPVENPKYAVIVLVVDGMSGGASCAPVARRVYDVLRDLPFTDGVSGRDRSLIEIVQTNESP